VDLDLRGHVLTLSNSNGVNISRNLYLANVKALSAGKIEVRGACIINAWVQKNSDLSLADVEFFDTALLRINAPATVKWHDYTTHGGTAIGNTGFKGLISASGTFKTSGAYFNGGTLKNGGTLDLSGYAGTFNTKGSYNSADASSSTLRFEAGTAVSPAQYTLKLAGRSDLASIAAAADNRIVNWQNSGYVPDTATVQFTLDEDSRIRGYYLELEETGIKLKCYHGLIIRIAGIAEDGLEIPADWAVVNAGVDSSDSGADIAAALTASGANDIPVWQSYCLGLEPANPQSAILCDAASEQPSDGAVKIVAKNLNVPAGLEGVAVTAYLDVKSGDGWNVVDTVPVTSGSVTLTTPALAESLSFFA
jgi:hypothetical protein